MTMLRVLYVDDEPDLREVATFSLELDPELEVRTAASGAEALAQLAADPWRPDVFLLDVMMPAMDGPTLLQALRARTDVGAAPAIFITARAQTQERERFLAAGAVGVIAKPFDPLGLAAEMRAILERAGAGPHV